MDKEDVGCFYIYTMEYYCAVKKNELGCRLPAAHSPRALVSTDFTKMPSQVEHAMETMMFTFHKFAGDKGYLTKEDLQVLMEKEFPGFLENQKDPLAVDKIMKDLDQCRDGKVGFQSFFSLITGLTIACNDYFVVHMKQKAELNTYSCPDESSPKGPLTESGPQFPCV
ncbi:protein S100-A10-like [Heterocephalus glaber]|uniref:Protein S100-A10 n=2 Tax=Heterocephalus glaber TaxID=10181 RepID=A0AAX6PJJ6_HETGA|nr:protein S100-A10-like [Heterocephalus glaber]